MHESALGPSQRLGVTPLFLAEGTVHTVDDAIRWGASHGFLGAELAETLKLAAADEGGPDVDDDAVQEASERFRYDRDLISAGETEEWLAARGMTIDDFGRWLVARLSSELGEAEPLEEEPDDLHDFFRIHLWLSGGMDKLAREYSRSVAAGMELRNREGETVDDLISAATTDAARKRKIAALATSLVRVEVDTLVVDSEAAGREAVLCVRADRQPLAEVAAEIGYRTDRSELWIDDAPPAVRQQLLGTAIGDAIGPVADGARFTVYQILRRKEPLLDDAEIRNRIDTMLIDELFADLCARHIQQPDVARTRT